MYKVPFAWGHVKLDGVAVTHELVVVEGGVSELGLIVVAPDAYPIGDVSPDVTEELGTRLDPCERTWRLELVRLDGLVAVFEDTSVIALLDAPVGERVVLIVTVGDSLEPKLVGENVKGDVDPFVVTQP
jgi:hypothetical protein